MMMNERRTIIIIGLTEKRYTVLLLAVIIISVMGIIIIPTRNKKTPTPDLSASSSSPVVNTTTTTTRFALAALLSVDGSMRAWWNQQKYIASAEKLALSFRRHSNLDMVLLVMDQYDGTFRKSDEARLLHSGWTVHRLREGIFTRENGKWESSSSSSSSSSTKKLLFDKLWMWRLSMYELILYTDLDTLFVESPDVLFRLRPSPQNPGMVLDTSSSSSSGNTHNNYFNTGVMLLHPSESEFQRLVTATNGITITTAATEQYFLNHYFHGRIIALDARFNRQVCAQQKEEGGLLLCLNDITINTREKLDALKDTATIIHFNGDNKPWNLKNCVQQNIVHLCMFWKHYGGTTS